MSDQPTDSPAVRRPPWWDYDRDRLREIIIDYESRLNRHTTCAGCRDDLDNLYAERVAGYEEGRRDVLAELLAGQHIRAAVAACTRPSDVPLTLEGGTSHAW